MLKTGGNRRPRGRPTLEEARSRDVAILTAASALFEQRGFAGVNMVDIARLASISKTTLYARYRDKTALFRAICSYACRVPGAAIAAVDVDGRSPADVLSDFGKAIVLAMRDEAADRFLRLAIFEAPRFPLLADQIAQESRTVTAPLTAYFAQLAGDGLLAGAGPAMLASQFVILVTGGHDGLLSGEAASASDDARLDAALSLILPMIGGGYATDV